MAVMAQGDPQPDSLPDESEANPDSPPAEHEDDRSDIERAVDARADAVARGKGGREPEPRTGTGTGDYSGNAGTGGEVKNQDMDAQ